MFDIEYKGANTVVISTKKNILVTDPKMSVLGESDYVVKNAIELATEERFRTGDRDFLLSISYPGSYEIGDFSINGFAEKRHLDGDNEPKKAVVYSIDVLGTKIGLLGNVGPQISDDQLENLGLLDILIIPIGGGGYTLDATSAAKIVRDTDVKVAIPIHYSEDGIKYDVPQSSIDIFTKELGVDVETTTKYKVKSVSSLPDKLTIVKINRSN